MSIRNIVSTYIAHDGSPYTVTTVGTTGYLTRFNTQGSVLARWVCGEVVGVGVIGINGDGYVYIYGASDGQTGLEVRKYTSTGELVNAFDVDDGGSNISPMTIDGNGNIYVQTYPNMQPRLRKYTNDGTLLAKTATWAFSIGLDMYGYVVCRRIS